MAEPTIQDFMSQMSGAFQADKAVGLDVIIQLKLTGTQPAEYVVAIKDQKCSVAPGTSPTPRLTASADAGDFMKIFTGKLDGTQAFMTGKLRLVGDMGLALKLLTLFKMK